MDNRCRKIIEVSEDFNLASHGRPEEKGWLIVTHVHGQGFLTWITVSPEFAAAHDMQQLKPGEEITIDSNGGRMKYDEDGDSEPILNVSKIRFVDADRDIAFNKPAAP